MQTGNMKERTTAQAVSHYSRRKRIPTNRLSPMTLAGGKASRSYEIRQQNPSCDEVNTTAESTAPRRETTGQVVPKQSPKASGTKIPVQYKYKASATVPKDAEEPMIEQTTTSPYSQRNRIPTNRLSPLIFASGKASRSYEKQQHPAHAAKDDKHATPRNSTHRGEMQSKKWPSSDPDSHDMASLPDDDTLVRQRARQKGCRITRDGCIIPIVAPTRNIDKTYKRPRGAAPLGFDWDNVRGAWVSIMEMSKKRKNASKA